MSNTKSSHYLLKEAISNCEYAYEIGDLNEALKRNNEAYEIEYEFYISTESKYFKNKTLESLDSIMDRSELIREELWGEGI